MEACRATHRQNPIPLVHGQGSGVNNTHPIASTVQNQSQMESVLMGSCCTLSTSLFAVRQQTPQRQRQGKQG
ncbi:unnamed protein product [Arctogadus glacialis]